VPWRLGFSRPTRIDLALIDGGYGEIRRLEMLNKALLMQGTPLRKRFKHGSILRWRPRGPSGSDS